MLIEAPEVQRRLCGSGGGAAGPGTREYVDFDAPVGAAARRGEVAGNWVPGPLSGDGQSIAREAGGGKRPADRQGLPVGQVPCVQSKLRARRWLADGLFISMHDDA